MTYLQLVNKVLVKLREGEVTSVSEKAYSKLIGSFVNEAMEEIEDSHNWSMLRQEFDVTTVASTNQYTITGLGDRYSVLFALNITEDGKMFKVAYDWIKRNLDLGTQSEGSPHYYAFSGQDSAGDPNINVSPVPNGVETLRFYVVKRSPELSLDTDTLSIPSRAVILGAYYRAIEERGEDLGDPALTAQRKYNRAWADAVAYDKDLLGEEETWQVD